MLKNKLGTIATHDHRDSDVFVRTSFVRKHLHSNRSFIRVATDCESCDESIFRHATKGQPIERLEVLQPYPSRVRGTNTARVTATEANEKRSRAPRAFSPSEISGKRLASRRGEQREARFDPCTVIEAVGSNRGSANGHRRPPPSPTRPQQCARSFRSRLFSPVYAIIAVLRECAPPPSGMSTVSM